MDRRIIVISGMPASGKDTVTNRLCKDSKFVAFKKHRSVNEESESKDTYINVSKEEFNIKKKRGDFIQYHSRYGRQYGIDREMLCEILESDSIPVIHIGRPENFYELQEGLKRLDIDKGFRCEIVHILLWEEIDVLKQRIASRDVGDVVQQKLIAAQEEFDDNKALIDKNENPYSYIIKNSDLEETCRIIYQVIDEPDNPPNRGFSDFMKYVLRTEDLNNEGQENSTSVNSIRCENNLIDFTIVDRIFSRNVEVKDIKSSEDDNVLTFENCIFENLKLSEIGCNEIRFINCQINGELLIFQGKQKRIVIRECSYISRIILEDLNKKNTDRPTLKVTASSIQEIKVVDSELEHLEFTDDSSMCNLVRFVKRGGVDIIKASCLIERLVIKELPRIILSKEGKFGLIELENVDKKILRNYEAITKEYNGDKHLKDDYKRYKSVVLAAYESFENRKMFSESDTCLFEIRRLGLIIACCNQPLLKVYLLAFIKFLLEDCFGWGIKIRNNIVTLFVVIFGFACIYSIISMIRQLGLGFERCFEIALNRFFIIGAGEFEATFFPYLDSIESIIGVILLTVITGVLVRKIIR